MSYAIWNVPSPQQAPGPLEQPRPTWPALKRRLSERGRQQTGSEGTIRHDFLQGRDCVPGFVIFSRACGYSMSDGNTKKDERINDLLLCSVIISHPFVFPGFHTKQGRLKRRSCPDPENKRGSEEM